MFWMMIACDMMVEQYNVAADPSDTTEFIFTVPKGSNAPKSQRYLEFLWCGGTYA